MAMLKTHQLWVFTGHYTTNLHLDIIPYHSEIDFSPPGKFHIPSKSQRIRNDNGRFVLIVGNETKYDQIYYFRMTK